MSVLLINMDRFSHRENVFLGYVPQRSFLNPNPSPKTPLEESDVDFHDVFGGPPRRSSINEMRYSFSETTSLDALRGERNTVSHSRRWSGLGEKPVFGEDGLSWRRYPSHDFFDDIFRGDESPSSTPRKINRDPFSSAPGSVFLSPARSLQPRAEPFGSSSSLTSQFSLPARLAKGMDFPALSSAPCSPSRNKDGASNGIISPSSPSTSVSRFSSETIHGQDEWRNDVRPSYRLSRLSNEFSFSHVESAKGKKSDKTDTGGKLKKDLNSSDVPTNGSQFHFSIYKWASKGVPLMMPLGGGSCSRLKENNIKRCLSSTGRVEYDRMVPKLTTETLSDAEFPFINDSLSANTLSSKMECKKQENESVLNTSTQDKLEPCQTVEEAVLPIPQSESVYSLQTAVEDTPSNHILLDTREEMKPHSLPDIGLCGKTEKEISVLTEEACKRQLKPLHSLFYGNKAGQGKDMTRDAGRIESMVKTTQESSGNDNVGEDKTTREAGRMESMVKTTKESSGNDNVGKSVKRKDGKRTISNGAEVDKASLQDSPINTRDNLGRNKIKGKVKEFVNFFNQEAPSKPSSNVDTQNKSFRWKVAGSFRAENVVNVSTNRTDGKMHMSNVDKKKTSTNVSVKADEYFKPLEKQHTGIDTTIHIFSDTSSGQKDSLSSSSESIPDGSKATLGNIDDSFQGNFQIKELSQEENKLPQTGKDHDDFQVSDAEVRKWSNGKEGNIRSLLSTLQYVLWPESGWKPVPLVDIIEGNAVKRAYQKALLCLHPDKLQQKGAAVHQKYIAEKVFEILQEAWIHLNALSSL